MFAHLLLMTTTILNCGSLIPGVLSSTTTNDDNSVYETGVIKQCMLLPAESSSIDKVEGHIGKAKLLKIELSLDNDDDIKDISGVTTDHMYKPLSWVRTTSRHGKGLLLLRPEFDVLSLTTLGLGVVSIDVPLKQHPDNCLTNLTNSEKELLIRGLVLNDFQNASDAVSSTGPSHSACNIHIRDMDGTAVFEYFCCYRNAENTVRCEYPETDVWLEVLFTVINILKIFIILFSPRFVPEMFYKDKHDPQPYVYKISSKQKLTLKTVLTKTPERFSTFKNKVKLSAFKNMPCFRTKLQNIEFDTICPYSLKAIYLLIDKDRLLNENFVPVGIFHTLYESFVKCNIRDKSSVQQCCYASICPRSCSGKNCLWYVFLKRIMGFVVLFILFCPWLARIYVYYKYEDEEMRERKKAAEFMDLDLYFPGSFALLLTPLHVLFIVIYAVLFLESIVFKVLQTKYEDEIKSNLRSCLRQMFEKDTKEVLCWAVRLTLKPFAFCGFLGLFVLPLWLIIISPIVLTVLAFYLFPTINITFRFLTQLIIDFLPRNICGPGGLCKPCLVLWKRFSKYLEMEEMLLDENVQKSTSILKSILARIQHVIVILMCIVSLYSVLFLITEFLSFIVEIIIYTMIGLVINASNVLKYLSLFVLVWFYANDCFGVVSKKFLAFNTTMNSVIFGLGKTELEEIVFKPEHKQENIAFTVSTEQNSVAQPLELVADSDEKLSWKIQRMLLFLNQKDEPLIPKRFYFNACKMDFYAVPGDVLGSYWQAAREFAVIIVFLLFVLIVVMAFGDTYEISATNELLVTISGGFVPLILRKVVFKSYSAPEIDTSAITFRVSLTNEIESYEENWPIFDIHVSDEETVEDTTEFVAPDNGPHSCDHTDGGEDVVEKDPTSRSMENVCKSDVQEIEIDLLIDASSDDLEDKFVVLTEENMV